MNYRASLLCLLFSISFLLSASAQNDDRREFIEGLFRSIIESRTQNTTPPGISIPVQPRPPSAQFPPSTKPTNQQLKDYEELIEKYYDQTDSLSKDLEKESIKNPNLRGYLSDLYTIRSQARHLHKTRKTVDYLGAVEPQFRALDTDWRDLSFRLQAEPSLDSGCRKTVLKIEKYGGELCELFGIQADFDRTRAVFIAGQATAFTSALVDLLQQQWQGQPSAAGILQEGRQLVGLANQFGLNLANLTLPQAMESCEEWGNAWNVYSAKLRMNHDPAIVHAICRVSTCQGELYSLMRIERPLDYPYLQQLSNQTQVSIQSLFNQLSLQALRGLSPNQIQALIAAQQAVSHHMQTFQRSVRTNSREDEVVQNFVDLYNSWKQVDRYLGSLHGQAANSRATVQAQMKQMGDFLQVSDAFDMNLILTHAASLEGLAGNLYTVLAQRAKFIPQQNFRNQVFLETQQFLQNTKIFHAQVANGSSEAALQKSCGTLLDSWQECSQLIRLLPSRGMQPQIYQSIDRVLTQIDPAVAELAVVLSP